MLNHLHLIAFAPDMIAFVRDFKKFTSREIQKSLLATEPKVLQLFLNDAGGFNLWEESNMPKSIETQKYLRQKVDYVHLNPVRKQYVSTPEVWLWSSANPENPIAVVHLET